MKVLVCGGRHYDNWVQVEEVLENFAITELIHGDATGADKLAHDYAQSRYIPIRRYPAEWCVYGSSAGPRRNKRMLDENPDIEYVIAFPGGRGTANMVKQARGRGIKVLEVV
jgi:hypothetical protein